MALSIWNPFKPIIEIVILSKSAYLNPSSTIMPQDRYLGIAPETARSFTVPHTESFPMSPPGKNKGLTTNESVVYASFFDPAFINAVVQLFYFGIPSEKRGLVLPGIAVKKFKRTFLLIFHGLVRMTMQTKFRKTHRPGCCNYAGNGGHRFRVPLCQHTLNGRRCILNTNRHRR